MVDKQPKIPDSFEGGQHSSGKHQKRNKQANAQYMEDNQNKYNHHQNNLLSPVKEVADMSNERTNTNQESQQNSNQSSTVNKYKRFQSFVKLRSDMFKVTSQNSFKSDATPQKNKKSNKLKKKGNDSSNNATSNTNSNNGKPQDYMVYFGDPEHIAQNQNKKYENKVRTQKYTIFSWAPLSLIYQFKRIANIYFLLISILTCFSFSPKDPASMIGTFVLVLVFTMLKEAYEDYQRYKQDKEVNNKLAYVLNPLTMQFEPTKWENIQRGNIVKFMKDQEAPADIAILYSSNKSGVVNVDTMNLDGETNLKEKNALIEGFDIKRLQEFYGELRCDAPNENLEKWDAMMNISKRLEYKVPIASIKNLLLRGCFIRNTDYGLGIVVYTGMQTKIMRNLKKPPHKISYIMRLMNKMLYSVFAFQICLIFLYAGLNTYWIKNNGNDHFYLNISVSSDTNGQAGKFFLQLLVFWVAYSHMIPISLYVIIEILKLGIASFIGKDLLMYDHETESFARCRNSDLIEELGQVEMVFSDKTGTLTQNKMIFKKCQINGQRFGDNHNNEKDNEEGMLISGIKEIRHKVKEEYQEYLDNQESDTPVIGYVTELLKILALCNTVLIEKNLDNPKAEPYKASSPDELALVKGAKICGMQLVSRQHNRVTIFNMITKLHQTYKVIAEFPFDSVRKRMSVILKDEEGKYMIYCKGADAVMLDRIIYEKNGIKDLKNIINQDLFQYSCEGLRTLMMTKRNISKEEYQNFKSIYNSIQESNSQQKEEKLFQLYDSMEQKLRYIGSTAIEDKLQEGVPITIKKLLEADIRFFMLTGDKLETAIEIAKSCQVIQDDMAVIILGKPEREAIYKKLNKLVNILQIDIDEEIKSLADVQQYNQVITIEGSTLGVVLSDEVLSNLLYHVAIRSKSVVCCRMSPKQKADVVNLFKSRGKWITLAIGDGANDVSMIMEAHIGVGIKGKEGTQAVRSADFSISQFQYLLRLLLLHGRNGYLRVSQMICYYFYKNIILVFTELYFAIYNGFSGQIYFLDWLPTMYNAFFTSWHCLFSQLMEKDINDHYSYRFPLVYKAGQKGLYFNFKVFWKWIIMAIWHGLVCFYGPIITGSDPTAGDSSGQTAEHWLNSTISFTIVIHLVFYKLLLETRHLNAVTIVSGLLSMLLYYGVLLIAQIPSISYLFQPQILGLVAQMTSYPEFWLMISLVPFVCLIPDFFIKIITKVFYPTPVDIVLMAQKKYPDFNFQVYLKKKEEKEQKKAARLKKEAEERKNKLAKKITDKANQDEDFSKQESNVNLSHLEQQRSRIASDSQSYHKKMSKYNDEEEDDEESSEQEQEADYDQSADSINNQSKKRIGKGKQLHHGKTITEAQEEEDDDDDEEDTDSDENNSGDEEDEEEEESESDVTESGLNVSVRGSQDRKSNKSGGSGSSKNNRKNKIRQKSGKDINVEDEEEKSQTLYKHKTKILHNNPDDTNRSMDQSFRSNRDLLNMSAVDAREKDLSEIRQSKKSEKSQKAINKQRSKKSTHSNKKSQKSQKNLNNSLFSVSDGSKKDLFINNNGQYIDLNGPNNNNNNGQEQQYLEYFEDLNKEILERKNTNNHVPKKQVTIQESKNSVMRLSDSNHKTKSSKRQHQEQQQQQQNSKMEVNDIESDNETNKQNLVVHINEQKPNSQAEITYQKPTKPTVGISKNTFTKILGNRTQDVFMLSTTNEIPKNELTKPSQIVDKISIRQNVVGYQERPNVQAAYQLGHPLESNILRAKSPDGGIVGNVVNSDYEGNQKNSARYSVKKKQKAYVEKYSKRQGQHNNNQE